MKKRLRGLDIDDLIMLDLLESGFNVSDTARLLNVTQPAVSQRLSKIKDILGIKIYYKGITPEARQLCLAAREALNLLSAAVGPVPDSSR